MGVFKNRDAKRFYLILISVLLLWMITALITSYISVLQFKSQMTAHDYRLAGYLLQQHPEWVASIPSLFTSEKSPAHLDEGQRLLEPSGYKESLPPQLMPDIDQIYRTTMTRVLLLTGLMSSIVLIMVYGYLRRHYRRIERYERDVQRIMNGETGVKLNDGAEGNLDQLAASINIMNASLCTHIEKERAGRLSLKDNLTNISHQLKTPLTALFMYNEIMKDENIDNDTIANFLNRSSDELERMQSQIASLLKLARLDAGVIDLVRRDCSINDIVKQVAESFETRIEREQKSLEIMAEPSVRFTCDREWMLEALSNLVKNAVEHTGAGCTIRVSIEETPLFVTIAVEDDGEGIHPDDIHFVFNRFYRSKLSQGKQGSGIGLTLAKSIIEMHQGFVRVQSRVEKGTVFTVHLPKLTNL
ncbi:MAG: HAMP domain-containing sensor histidine kinase [Syntrophomonadaceae bacterium]